MSILSVAISSILLTVDEISARIDLKENNLQYDKISFCVIEAPFYNSPIKTIIIMEGDYHELTALIGINSFSKLMHLIQLEKLNVLYGKSNLYEDAKCPKKIWEIISGEENLHYEWIES